MPIPQLFSNLNGEQPSSLFMKSIILLAPGEFGSHSIPEYKSSVFSLNTTISVRPDSAIGVLVPGKYLIGLTHANKSNFCLILTFIDLWPFPIGVVSGPLIEIL